MTMGLFSPYSEVASTDEFLSKYHYLGPCKRGRFAWVDRYGCIVFASPSSRNLPTKWFELSRWCLVHGRNNGSRQWCDFIAWARNNVEATTIVSYSDPTQGHTGALYRACNWLWAPTWHRLRPPPSGCGSWTGAKIEAVKDRWIYPLTPDVSRAAILQVKDVSIVRRMPWAEYHEPRWSGARFRPDTGGGDYQRFIRELRNAD